MSITQTVAEMASLPELERIEAREAMRRVKATAHEQRHGMPTKAIDRNGRLWLAYQVGGWWYVPASREGVTFSQDGFRVRA